MKFTQLLRQVILESGERIDFLIDTYAKPKKKADGSVKKPKLSVEELSQLVAADPTSVMGDIQTPTKNLKELEKVKSGKYASWLIKSYLALNQQTETPFGQPAYEREVKALKETFLEDLYKYNEYLKKFDRFKSRLPLEKREISKLSPNELYNLVKDFSLEKTKATKDEKKEASRTYQHPGAEIVFRGDQWVVAKISDTGQLGKDAACFYGGNKLGTGKGETEWCTSSPGYNWFDRYIKDGPLYVVLPTNPGDKIGSTSGLPAKRYQFHFQSNQFMDADDRSINLVEYLNGPMQELKNYFKPEFAKGLTVGGEKLVIDSFTSGAIGKYIALYGLEDLFSSLPETLTEFQIQNRDSKNNIIITIPAEIGRFKKLNMVLLDNCISSIPEEICQLPQLRFLALINNPQLTSIPSCIANLPELFFLNLKGSNNVDVPQEIQDKGTPMGNGMWDMQE